MSSLSFVNCLVESSRSLLDRPCPLYGQLHESQKNAVKSWFLSLIRHCGSALAAHHLRATGRGCPPHPTASWLRRGNRDPTSSGSSYAPAAPEPPWDERQSPIGGSPWCGAFRRAS